jgi:hypothetical protein
MEKNEESLIITVHDFAYDCMLHVFRVTLSYVITLNYLRNLEELLLLSIRHGISIYPGVSPLKLEIHVLLLIFKH